MALPRPVVRIANTITNAAIIAGIPRPPYTRKNALVIETVGRRTGKRRRIPVGYLDDDGRILVVVEDGAASNWVRNALAQGGHLRIHLRGQWRLAKLRMLDAEPEAHLRRMNRIHAGLVRSHSTTPGVAELVLEEGRRAV
jgi:deazaflavin-dependent oxidoreductase (nitroreductase family)